MIGESYMKQIIFSLKHWVNNNFALKENIPEVPVTSVNNMTGDVIIDIPTLDSLGAQPVGNYLTSINGITADEEGNINIDIPEHTWESLPDKPFGEKASEKDYFLTLTSIPAHTDMSAYEIENGIGITPIKSNLDYSAPNYVIVLDGVAYSNLQANSRWLEGVTYDYVSVGSDYYSFIDLSEDNPVVIRSMNGRWYVKVFDGSTSHTVEMYQQDVTVDTIDSKFIGSDIARISDIPDLSTYEFITVADIDTICGAQIVNASEVSF